MKGSMRSSCAELRAVALAVLLIIFVAVNFSSTRADSPLLSREESANYAIHEWYFDPELKRNVGIIVSRIIIENETADLIQGYVSDSIGNRLDVIDGIQVTLAKFVLNNTGTTRWQIIDWLDRGYFTIDKLDRTDIVAVRIYIGPADYAVADNTASTGQSWVFINPAWYEYAFAVDEGTPNRVYDAHGSNASSSNLYDPKTYDARHCTYILDLHSVYDHCTKLYVKSIRQEKVHQADRYSDEPRKEMNSSSAALSHLPVNSTDSPGAGANASLPQPATILTDKIDELVELECRVPSGTFFGLGANQVTCNSQEDPENMTEVSLNITITDSRMPQSGQSTIDKILSHDGPKEMTVLLSMNATELADSSPSASCDLHESSVLSSVFPLAIMALNCATADSSGNLAEARLHILRIAF